MLQTVQKSVGWLFVGSVIVFMIGTGIAVLVLGLTASISPGDGHPAMDGPDLRSFVLGGAFILVGVAITYGIMSHRLLILFAGILGYAILGFLFRLSIGGPHLVFGVPLLIVGLVLLLHKPNLQKDE